MCPHCHRFPLDEYILWGSKRHGKNSATGGARRAASSTVGGTRADLLVIQDRANPSEAKVFRAHALPQGVCENLVCALKLLADQQTGGDGLVDALFEGFPGAAEDYG